MRGRKPRPIEIVPDDIPLLQHIAHSQTLPWYQVRRARILLGIAHGARTEILAFLTQCAESTVRRTCRRYERLGLSSLLDAPRRAEAGGAPKPAPAAGELPALPSESLTCFLWSVPRTRSGSSPPSAPAQTRSWSGTPRRPEKRRCRSGSRAWPDDPHPV